MQPVCPHRRVVYNGVTDVDAAFYYGVTASVQFAVGVAKARSSLDHVRLRGL